MTAYPAGLFSIGQTLGFDVAGTDPQQTLPATAYSFVMQRQDCASGCPRVEVQRWTGTMTGQFVVPAMPYPSHLYLVATVTDAQGATGSRELRIDPQPVLLKLRTKGADLKAKVDGVLRKDGWSGHAGGGIAGEAGRAQAPGQERRALDLRPLVRRRGTPARVPGLGPHRQGEGDLPTRLTGR